MSNYNNFFSDVVREATILTTSYVTHEVTDANGTLKDLNQFDLANVYVDFTIGSLTSCEVALEYSYNGTDWYPESFGSVTSAIDTISPNAYHQVSETSKFSLNVTLGYRFLRIKVKGTGTVTSSSVTITVDASSN